MDGMESGEGRKEMEERVACKIVCLVFLPCVFSLHYALDGGKNK